MQNRIEVDERKVDGVIGNVLDCQEQRGREVEDGGQWGAIVGPEHVDLYLISLWRGRRSMSLHGLRER